MKLKNAVIKTKIVIKNDKKNFIPPPQRLIQSFPIIKKQIYKNVNFGIQSR